MSFEKLDETLNAIKNVKVGKIKMDSKYNMIQTRIKSINQALENGHTVKSLYYALSIAEYGITFNTFRLYVDKARKSKNLSVVNKNKQQHISKATETKTESAIEQVSVNHPATESVDISKSDEITKKVSEIVGVQKVVGVDEITEVSAKSTKSEFLENLRANDNLLKKDNSKQRFMTELSDDEL